VYIEDVAGDSLKVWHCYVLYFISRRGDPLQTRDLNGRKNHVPLCTDFYICSVRICILIPNPFSNLNVKVKTRKNLFQRIPSVTSILHMQKLIYPSVHSFLSLLDTLTISLIHVYVY
jgi:hypothetical protein